MTAAAYAKDLLCRIPPNSVEAEKRISDILRGLHEVATAQLDNTKELVRVQKDFAKKRLSDEEEQCHQLFRLKTGSGDTTYEWYKSRVDERVEDTCLRFLQHERFQMWLNQESGPLLVTADPGCGKSVLAKHLIDHQLPQSSTICYFFFKDNDQNTVWHALCALLHQLFSKKSCLIKHAITQFRKDGQRLIYSTDSLWKVLKNATKDSRAGPIVFVLDALDECAPIELKNLLWNIDDQFPTNLSHHDQSKYLLTSRPYEQILSKFSPLLDTLPNIRIPGEAESETISEEVSRVIKYRVDQLVKAQNLPDTVRDRLLYRLLKCPYRTYLWVYLVFDYLETTGLKKTAAGVDSAIRHLPETVNDAYEQILSKSTDPWLARKALCAILAACRPLTLSEMNVIMNIDYTVKSIHDLDLEAERDFELSLRRWCGLFVSIHHGQIYFLHQTAREFLLADLALPIAVPPGLRWHRSITTRQAHTVLAEACKLYLDFFNSFDRLQKISLCAYTFLYYSAIAWGAHFREAGTINNAAIISCALRIRDPDSKSYSTWFDFYWLEMHRKTPRGFTNFMVAAYFGHEDIVRLLLIKGANVEAKDSEYGRTPLLLAAENGQEAVVTLLLEKGANTEERDSYFSQTPLSWAAENGDVAVVKLLLSKGADVNATSKDGQTPLLLAANKGHVAVVDYLIRAPISRKRTAFTAGRYYHGLLRTGMRPWSNFSN